MESVLKDPKLEALLQTLHQSSRDQDAAITRYYREERTGPWNGMEARDHAFMSDKMVALEKDKAEFCYMTCRAIGARRIFEAGTSCGVSTIYLAAAVRDNGGGTVFGAEYEPGKVKEARANFAAAGLSDFIELREGDVVDAARDVDGPIDFVLFDIWGDMIRSLLEILMPRLRPGAVVCADNTGGERNRATYAGFFDVLENPANGFRTLTLPFEGGFEFAVKT